MASSDDIWASMKNEENARLEEYRARASALKAHKGSDNLGIDLLSGMATLSSQAPSSYSSSSLVSSSPMMPGGLQQEKKVKKKKSTGDGDKDKDKAKASKGSKQQGSNAASATNKALQDMGLVMGLNLLPPKASKPPKTTPETSASTANSTTPAVDALVSPNATTVSKPSIDATEMMSKIARDISIIDDNGGSDNVGARRAAFTRLYSTLFVTHTMNACDYSSVFRDICRSIFKRFTDTSEQCRERAFAITRAFFENCQDTLPVLGYFFPSLMRLLPPSLAYDEDVKVFVTDLEAHEAYRRGRAVDRQDKGGAGVGGREGGGKEGAGAKPKESGLLTHSVIEVSEEIRLLALQTLHTLFKRTTSLGSSTILHPYFQECIMYIQHQLRDPFHDIKSEACNMLEFLAMQEEYVTGMKFFAVGLVRAILPVLRHRHARVRVAAINAMRACVCVPDRAKCKGAGTEAIQDLVGFREENVLSVAAFYKTDVQVNYLAELTSDVNVQVREALTVALTTFLTLLPDRFDHGPRLLPYLLDLLTDETPSVWQAAWEGVCMCGKLYEEEHRDEIIEKKQYGVDGDDGINLSLPFPHPFKERPSIGSRLFVRGNTKRFLNALVGELTNWQSKTRLKSAHLLKVVLVFCEEHLTMEAHSLLPLLIKALSFAREDKDQELYNALLIVFDLVGRYMPPDTYIHFILPRLRGDPTVTQFGMDTPTRLNVLECLQALLQGTKPSKLPVYLEDLVTVLTDPYVIDPESAVLPLAAVKVIVSVLEIMNSRGGGRSAIEAHFLTTGRLTTLKRAFNKAFTSMVIYLSDANIQPMAARALTLLSQLDADTAIGGVPSLFKLHTPSTVRNIIRVGGKEGGKEGGGADVEYGDCLYGSEWSERDVDYRLLRTLLLSPWNWALCDGLPSISTPSTPASATASATAIVSSSSSSNTNTNTSTSSAGLTLTPLASEVVAFLCASVKANASDTSETRAALRATSSLLVSFLSPLCVLNYTPDKAISCCYKDLLTSHDMDTWPGAVQTHHLPPSLPPSIHPSPSLCQSVSQIIDVFVKDIKWTQTPSLEACRLSVLSMLTLYFPPSLPSSLPSPLPACQQTRDSFVFLSDADLTALCPSLFTTIFAPLSVVPPLSSYLSSSHTPSISITSSSSTSSSSSSSSSSLSPSHPQLRLYSASLLGHVLRLLAKGTQATIDDIVTAAEGGEPPAIRLMAFTSLPPSIPPSLPPSIPPSLPPVGERKTAAQAGISILVSMLNDSSESVVLAVLEALEQSLPLVLPDPPSSLPPSFPPSLPPSTHPTHIQTIHFSLISSVLLFQLSNISHSHTLLDLADRLLRSLAILDPSTLQSLIRNAMPYILPPPSSPSREQPSNMNVTELLSGLLDHCEMMQSFQQIGNMATR